MQTRREHKASAQNVVMVVFCFLCVTWNTGFAGETMKDIGRGYSLILPDGFKAIDTKESPDIAHAFTCTNGSGDCVALLSIKHFDRLMEQKEIEGSSFKAQWQGFPLEVFEVPATVDGNSTITLNVIVPLKLGAIQLHLFGLAQRKAELKTVLEKTLQGLQGESSWIPSATGPSTPPTCYKVVLYCAAGLVVVGGVLGLCFISVKGPKGAVMILGIVIWLIGSRLDFPVLEFQFACGAMKLLGFIGFVLGFVDLFRKRKHQNELSGDASEDPPTLN